MLVQPLTAAPDLNGWAITERLLKDLAPLADRVWLVIDDAHELGPETLRQRAGRRSGPAAGRWGHGARRAVELGTSEG